MVECVYISLIIDGINFIFYYFDAFVFVYISLNPGGINVIFYCVAAIMFSAFFTFICYVLCSSSFLNATYHHNFDVIVILGAAIFTNQVTPMLAKRLDKALELYQLY